MMSGTIIQKNTWRVMNETTFLRYSYYIYSIFIYITPPFHSIFFIYNTPFCTLDLPRIKWSSMLIYIYCHNQSLGREKIVFICSYILFRIPWKFLRWGMRQSYGIINENSAEELYFFYNIYLQNWLKSPELFCKVFLITYTR